MQKYAVGTYHIPFVKRQTALDEENLPYPVILYCKDGAGVFYVSCSGGELIKNILIIEDDSPSCTYSLKEKMQLHQIELLTERDIKLEGMTANLKRENGIINIKTMAAEIRNEKMKLQYALYNDPKDTLSYAIVNY